MQTLQTILSSPWFLLAWGAVTLPCLAIVIRDLRNNNAHLMSLMKLVWCLTVSYSGPVGLAVYWWSGRKEISHDSLPRRAARSVAHCYAGCSMGEVAGIFIAAGLLSLGTVWVAATTFALAYISGFALTVGPLVQEGRPLRTALRDAVLAETPSITVMEVTAIGIDLALSGDATMGEPLFWSSLVVSLSCGLLAAWPVNVLLVHLGVKEGMMDPRHGVSA